MGMRIKTKICLLMAAACCLASAGMAQSSLFLRNSSWLGFGLSVRQLGPYVTDTVNFAQYSARSEAWQPDTEVFLTARDSATVPAGQYLDYEVAIGHGADSIRVQFRLEGDAGTTSFAHRLLGSGFDTGWSSDDAFHSATTTIAGRDLVLQYKADQDDSNHDMDIRLAIHELPIYAIDSADFSNPNVLNLMAYNIQFLPLGVVGLPQAADRGDLLPAQFSPYQDVVILQEAFDPLPRLLNLTPAMEAAGFVHNTGILNDYLPFNGGVIIFSKWPIEATDQYDYELCGPNAQDCLANKGVMYAKVNKLGKYYHVFGTHMDAGSDSADIAAKTLQYAEMRDFIAAQGIPNSDAVVWGGDLNTDAANSHNLYYTLRDSIDILVPDYSGYHESTMNGDTGDVIDHLFIHPDYLLPLEAEVFITTFRSLDPTLWELSDFSDHRAAIGHFRYPDLSVSGGDQDLCPGDPMQFQSSADIPVQRTWLHDGQPIPGVTGPGITVASSTPSDAGLYELEMAYTRTYGTGPGPINALLNPNGPDTRTARPLLRAGMVTVDVANCPIAAADGLLSGLTLGPNPTDGIVRWQMTGGAPLAWRLMDLQGRTMGEGRWLGPSGELDMGQWPAGTYLLQLQGRKGETAMARIAVVR